MKGKLTVSPGVGERMQRTYQTDMPPAPMRCGYCTDPAVAWVEWSTIGRPKGAPMCQVHLDKANHADNWGQFPTIEKL